MSSPEGAALAAKYLQVQHPDLRVARLRVARVRVMRVRVAAMRMARMRVVRVRVRVEPAWRRDADDRH